MSLVNILKNWVKEDAKSRGVELTDAEAERVITAMENNECVIDCYTQTLEIVQEERTQ